MHCIVFEHHPGHGAILAYRRCRKNDTHQVLVRDFVFGIWVRMLAEQRHLCHAQASLWRALKMQFQKQRHMKMHLSEYWDWMSLRIHGDQCLDEQHISDHLYCLMDANHCEKQDAAPISYVDPNCGGAHVRLYRLHNASFLNLAHLECSATSTVLHCCQEARDNRERCQTPRGLRDYRA